MNYKKLIAILLLIVMILPFVDVYANGAGSAPEITLTTTPGGSSLIPGLGLVYRSIDASPYRDIVSADIDGDGDIDLVGAAGSSVYKYINDGSQNFTKTQIMTGFLNIEKLFADDIDGDGDIDIILGDATTGTGNGRLSVLKNNGSGTFTETTIGNQLRSLFALTADLDGDGRKDIVFTTSTNPIDKLNWAKQNADGTFTHYQIGDNGGRNTLVVTDFDGDTDMDIISTAEGAGKVYLWKNNGSETFIRSDIATIAGARAVSMGDIDGDGHRDIVVSSKSENSVTWFKNNGSGSFTANLIDSTLTFALDAHNFDYDGDGDLDIVAISYTLNKYYYFENDGKGNFTKSQFLQNLTNPRSVKTVDLDGDGDNDVLVTADASGAGWFETGVIVRGVENSSLVFSEAEDRKFVVADADGGSLTGVLSIPVGKGTIAVTTGGGATITGDGTNSVSIAGTIAQVNAALATVTYTPTANQSDIAYTTLTYSVNDGTTTVTKSVSVDIADVLNAPTLSINNATLSYTENDDAVQIDSAATAADPDANNNWNGGKLEIQITSNGENADRLTIPDNIVGNLNTNGNEIRAVATVIGELSASEGSVAGMAKLTITFNSNTTDAHIQSLIRAIHYDNTSDAPGTGDRIIRFSLRDKDGYTVDDTRTISVTAINDAPVLSGAGDILDYRVGDIASVIDNSLDLTDVDDTHMESATVSITGGYVNTEDELAFVNANNITGSWDGTTGILTLSGNDTLGNYEAALEAVTYQNSNTSNPNADNRTVTWVANDGDANSASVTSTITVTEKTYTIAYDANDGSGTTASSAHTYGVAKNLTANGFTRTGYSFAGWNSAANGLGTSYSDEESVTNLSSVQGATVTLYAKWTANVDIDIATDKAALDATALTYADGDAPNDVKSNITLPTAGANGTTISWAEKTDTGNNVVVSGDTVTVTRPLSDQGDQTVTLTATISKAGGTSETKDIVIVVKASNPATYTLTFDSDGGSAVGAITQASGTAVVAPATPTKTGYIFTGWNPDLPATIPAESVTYVAQWSADPTGDLGGAITDGVGPVAGVAVRLMKGGTNGTQYGTTITTDVNGAFSFTALPYGMYSLVGTKDSKTITKAIVIQAPNTTENMVMPVGDQQTIVEVVGNGTPSVAVSNLDDMFTADDLVIIGGVGEVTITLVVEQKAQGEVVTQASLIQGALQNNKEVGAYFDISMLRTVTGTIGDNVNNQLVQPPAGKKVSITIDLPIALRNKAPYQVIRVHNSVAAVLPATYNPTLHTLTFEADLFSVYSIVYTKVVSEDSGSDSSSGSVAIVSDPTTGVIEDGKIKPYVVINKNLGNEIEITLKETVSKIFEADVKGTDLIMPIIKDSEKITVNLNGRTVELLAVNESNIIIETNRGSTSIKAGDINLADFKDDAGKPFVPENITVSIVINSSSLTNHQLENLGKDFGVEIVMELGTVDVVLKSGQTVVNVEKFDQYVIQKINLPKGMDGTKITTAVFIDDTGSINHIPTEVSLVGEQYYAIINSFYPGLNQYLIWNPVNMQQVENHWSKTAVNDLASRQIITNKETYEPNQSITRAVFAEYIVRALGVYRKDITILNGFTDVETSNEQVMAILIANEYGIVQGYPDGTFRSQALITREEAMTMYQRAMKITKLVGTNEKRFLNYTDFAEVGTWATTYVKEVLSAHVFNGTSATTISPKSNLTYAEAAQAIKNLLVKSKLINN